MLIIITVAIIIVSEWCLNFHVPVVKLNGDRCFSIITVVLAAALIFYQLVWWFYFFLSRLFESHKISVIFQYMCTDTVHKGVESGIFHFYYYYNHHQAVSRVCSMHARGKKRAGVEYQLFSLNYAPFSLSSLHFVSSFLVLSIQFNFALSASVAVKFDSRRRQHCRCNFLFQFNSCCLSNRCHFEDDDDDGHEEDGNTTTPDNTKWPRSEVKERTKRESSRNKRR